MINGIDYFYYWEHPEAYPRMTAKKLNTEAAVNLVEEIMTAFGDEMKQLIEAVKNENYDGSTKEEIDMMRHDLQDPEFGALMLVGEDVLEHFLKNIRGTVYDDPTKDWFLLKRTTDARSFSVCLKKYAKKFRINRFALIEQGHSSCTSVLVEVEHTGSISDVKNAINLRKHISVIKNSILDFLPIPKYLVWKNPRYLYRIEDVDVTNERRNRVLSPAFWSCKEAIDYDRVKGLHAVNKMLIRYLPVSFSEESGDIFFDENESLSKRAVTPRGFYENYGRQGQKVRSN